MSSRPHSQEQRDNHRHLRMCFTRTFTTAKLFVKYEVILSCNTEEIRDGIYLLDWRIPWRNILVRRNETEERSKSRVCVLVVLIFNLIGLSHLHHPSSQWRLIYILRFHFQQRICYIQHVCGCFWSLTCLSEASTFRVKSAYASVHFL